MEKAKGAAKKGWKTRSHDVTALSEVGVTKMQSSRWQSIAALPRKDFEGYMLHSFLANHSAWLYTWPHGEKDERRCV